MDPIYDTGYAVGTVLAGYIFAIPAWGISCLWNRFLPARAGNPWTFPLVTTVFIILLMVLDPHVEYAAQLEGWVIGLGMIPALLWCLFRRAGHGRNKEEPKL